MNSDGVVVIDTVVNTDKALDSIEELEKEIERLDQLYDEIDAKPLYQGQADDMKKVRLRAQELNEELKKIKDNKDIKITPTIDTSSVSADNYLDKIERKIKRKGVALLGSLGLVAGALAVIDGYLGKSDTALASLQSIGKAFSNLASQIGDAIINFVGPYIEKFINWLVALVGYLNVFIKAISGGKIDMTRSMAKNEKATEKTTKAIGKQSSAMKELNKQLAKFDEATTLQSNKASAGGFGGGSTLDVGADEETLDDISKAWDDLLDPSKVAKVEEFADKVKEAVMWFVDPIGQAKKAIDVHSQLMDDLNNVSKKGEKYYEVNKKIKNISKDVNATLEQVAGAYDHNIRSITKHNDSMQQNINTIKDANWVDNILVNTLGIHTKLYSQNTRAIIENAEEIENSISNNRRLIENKKLTNDQIKATIETYREEREALRRIREQLPENSKAYKEVDDAIKMLTEDIRYYGKESDFAIEKVAKFGFENKKATEESDNYFKTLIGEIDVFNSKKLENKKATIELETNITKMQTSLAGLANSVGNAFQRAFNNLDLFASIRKSVNNMSSDLAISIRKVFGLAKGGIINMPGPGVPLGGNVIGGERGAEGVIPLTDAQMMETLGEAIGRYVTINANITNTMNGRVISRELQKINGESDFANNR